MERVAAAAGGSAPFLREYLSFGRSPAKDVPRGTALLRKEQRHGVEAMTLTGRRRTVGEHVTEMTAAARTDLFHAHHSVAGVAHPPDVPLVERLEEARPAGTGVELGIRPEEWQTAKPAGVDPVFVVVQKHPTERGFGTVSEQDVPLVRC
jgi:hypothetical protein